MLTLININKNFSKNIIFEDLNISLSDGIYLISGKNGVGKTTLCNILTNSTSFRGQVLLNSQKFNANEYISYMTQENNLLINNTFIENVKILVGTYDYEKLEELLKYFNMAEFISSNTLMRELSGGEQKILQFIINIIEDKDIIILDEVDNHLSETNRDKLLEFIHTLKNKIVIVVSHNWSKEQYNHLFKVINLTKNCSYTSDDNLKRYKKIESKNVNRKVSRILLKNNKIRFGSSIVLFCMLMLISFISLITFINYQTYINKKYEYQSDEAMIIYPPAVNNYFSVYGDVEWFEKTNAYFSEEQYEMLKNNKKVNKIEPLPDVDVGYRSVVIDSKDYLVDEDFKADFNLLLYNKEISDNLYDANGLFYSGYNGEYPNDNSNEVIIEKRFAEQNDLDVGESFTIPISNAYDVDDIKNYEVKVVGIAPDTKNDSPQIYIAYDGRGETVMSEEDKTNQKNHLAEFYSINTDFSDQNYYYGFYIESDDIISLSDEIFEYDKYIQQRSNYSFELSQVGSYMNQQLKSVKLITLFLLSGLLMISLSFYLFDNVRNTKKICETLFSFNYNKKSICKFYRVNLYKWTVPYLILLITINSTFMYLVNQDYLINLYYRVFLINSIISFIIYVAAIYIINKISILRIK